MDLSIKQRDRTIPARLSTNTNHSTTNTIRLVLTLGTRLALAFVDSICVWQLHPNMSEGLDAK